MPNEGSIKRETLQAIVAGFNCASDDAIRHNLTGVLVTAASDKVKVVATTGHMISVVEVPDPDAAKLIGETSYFASREELPMLKLLLKEIKKIGGCQMVADDGAVTLQHGAVRVTIKSSKAQGIAFPDYQTLFNGVPYPDDTPCVGLNPEYLLDLFKAMADGDLAKRPTMKLVFKDKLSPIVVVIGENTGLLMPMRIGGK
jgi:hypothetical protein